MCLFNYVTVARDQISEQDRKNNIKVCDELWKELKTEGVTNFDVTVVDGKTRYEFNVTDSEKLLDLKETVECMKRVESIQASFNKEGTRCSSRSDGSMLKAYETNFDVIIMSIRRMLEVYNNNKNRNDI